MTEPQVPLSATGSSLRRLHRYLFPLKGLKHLPRIPGLRVRQPLIMPSAEKTGPRRLSAVNRLHGTRSSKRDYAHPACLSSQGGGGGGMETLFHMWLSVRKQKQCMEVQGKSALSAAAEGHSPCLIRKLCGAVPPDPEAFSGRFLPQCTENVLFSPWSRFY